MSNDERILEQMLERAIDQDSGDIDELAAGIFCTTIRNNSDVVEKSTDLLVSKIKGSNVNQALRALTLLEECMSKCGPDFQKEVSKFRFLNKLIPLVSKRYQAAETPVEIREKIMDCLLLWTTQHPERTKISEAYEMLRKEGVQHSPLTTVSAGPSSSKRDSCMTKEEESKLRVLLQSQNPDDLKRANLLIQYVVKQDAKRDELRIRQKTELQEIQNTVDLFNQILETYVSEGHQNGEESLSLMKELYENCDKYKPILIRLPDTIDENEVDLVADTIEVNDALLAVMERYQKVCNTVNQTEYAGLPSIPTEASLASSSGDLLSGLLENLTPSSTIPTAAESGNILDDLHDIFSPTKTTELGVFSNISLLEPKLANKSLTDLNKEQDSLHKDKNIASSGHTFLKEIDSISESLFKESLKTSERIPHQFKKPVSKVSLNELMKDKKSLEKDSSIPVPERKEDIEKLNITSIPDAFDDLCVLPSKPVCQGLEDGKNLEKSQSEDEEILGNVIETKLVSISDDQVLPKEQLQVPKPLSEMTIELDDVTPNDLPQKVIFEEKNGLKVTLDFTDNRPSKNVSVVVFSVINYGKLPIESFQIEASVKKPSKIRLLAATGNSLPGLKPFRPIASINQIMLVYNPTKADVDITCILGYKCGDDPDLIKESIIAKNIPFVE